MIFTRRRSLILLTQPEVSKVAMEPGDLVEPCPNDECFAGRVQVGVERDFEGAELYGLRDERRLSDYLPPRDRTCAVCGGAGEVLTETGALVKRFVEDYVIDDD